MVLVSIWKYVCHRVCIDYHYSNSAGSQGLSGYFLELLEVLWDGPLLGEKRSVFLFLPRHLSCSLGILNFNTTDRISHNFKNIQQFWD